MLDTLALADTAEAVAALVPEVTHPNVAHVHVPGVRLPEHLGAYERMEPIYAAGHAALDALTIDGGYSDWTPTEHYGHGINWQWIHLPSGNRIALTWIA